jgi:glycyl-tRNA synthetase
VHRYHVAERITVGYETKENHTVTLRDRDSMKQVRVGVSGLPEIVWKLVAGTKTLAEPK